MDSNKNFKIFITIYSILISVLVYFYYFRNNLLGDPFDSRLIISLHEHWWKWLNGEVDLRDTQFFYPFDKALGFSDSYLFQGLLYSFFRILSLDILNSWTLTNVLLFILGNIGWTFLIQKLLVNRIILLISIFILNANIVYINYLTENPNLGYGFIPWVIILMISILNEKNTRMRNIKIATFIILLTFFALSCWYAFFFTIMIIMFKLILDFYSAKSYIILKKVIKNLLSFYKFYPLIILSVGLFLYIYLPNINSVVRDKDELIYNSPRFIDLIVSNNSTITKLFIEKFKNSIDVHSNNLSLSIFLISLLIFCTIYFYKHLNNFSLNKFWIASIFLVLFYFTILIDSYSIHSFLFLKLPGLNSIRFADRYLIVFSYFALIIIFIVLEKIYLKYKGKVISILVILSLLFLIFDQTKFKHIGWENNLMVNQDLNSVKNKITQNCDFYYYKKPGAGWWYDQIEAITFSTQIGIPTINGYSGAFPKGYPTETWDSVNISNGIINWIDQIDHNLKGCLILGKTLISPLNQKLKYVELIGFTNIESKGKEYWQWAVNSNPAIILVNFTQKDILLDFKISNAPCIQRQRIKIINSQNSLIFDQELESNNKNIKLKLEYLNKVIEKFQIISDSRPCNVKNDPRSLLFEIKNLTYE